MGIRRDEAFSIFMQGAADPETGAREGFFSHIFSKAVVEDIQGRPDDGVKGTLQYTAGDRIGYSTAYCFLSHEDPGHHERLNGFRFHYQLAGSVQGRIVDKFGGELHPQGVVQYPYEGSENDVPYDTKYPGGTLVFAHQRFNADERERFQLMGVRTIPAVEPGNPKVKWFYQRTGLFLAVHDDHGPICKLIVASMHPRYAFGTRELVASNLGRIEKAINRGEIVLPEGDLP